MTLDGIAAITFDFGNTLVPVSRDGLRGVVERTAADVADTDPRIDAATFLTVWAEERERQFREEVPQFREVDLGQRLVRIFARLRGMTAPGRDEPWDQRAAAAYSDPAEVTRAVEHYSRAFVDALPPLPGVGELLRDLARERALAILSNWPLAATVDRFAEAHGWIDSLAAIVVSQRVGTIKPHPAIFDAARVALGAPEPGSILHVGDDWAGDVVGAIEAGWHAAWVRGRPADSPLPSSEADGPHRPDLELESVVDLRTSLGRPGSTQPAARRSEPILGSSPG
ncbi:MAG TPA: HAD family hydrolase [Candidatus Limnocylindrales bacterium]|nr:HAD family hydrolase [Candidatus Limnocylindrales bacterium]